MISEENLFYLIQKNWQRLNNGEKIKILQNVRKDVEKYFNLQKHFEVCHFEIVNKIDSKISKPCELFSVDNNFIYLYNLTDALTSYFVIIQLGIIEMIKEAEIGLRDEIILQFDISSESLRGELMKFRVLRDKLIEKSQLYNNRFYYDLYLMENIINQISTYDAYFYIMASLDKSTQLPHDIYIGLYEKVWAELNKYIFVCTYLEKQLGHGIKEESDELENIYYDPDNIEEFTIIKNPEYETLKRSLRISFQEIFKTSKLKFGYYDDSATHGLK